MIGETELVVTAAERLVQLDSREYYPQGKLSADPTIVTRYRYEAEVTVYEARTGRVIETIILRGSDPEPFRTYLPAGTKELIGQQIPYQHVEQQLRCLIESSSCEHPG